ncbi:MAG: glycosyltransferase family 2 protein [Candidatus Gastranaerophilales bacterium]|nr:glycosyltransferase family 2 protein [Candidatus Gastranaerophilales bacterium]
MNIINLLLIFYSSAVLYFIVYKITILINHNRGRIKEIENRDNTIKYCQDISIIVYSHNNCAKLMDLIECIKKQNYPTKHYNVNVILDNCTDESAKKLEIIGGARIFRLTTDEGPVGRNKGYAWLLKRVLSTENTNIFVFIDSNYYIQNDFLQNINNAIDKNPVITASIKNSEDLEDICSDLQNTIDKIKIITDFSRNTAGLSTFINMACFAIRQDVLEKVTLGFWEKDYEALNFAINLSKSDYKISYAKDVKAYRQRYDSISSFTQNIIAKFQSNTLCFIKNIKTLLTAKFTTKEFVLSLLYLNEPCFLGLMIISAIILKLCINSSIGDFAYYMTLVGMLLSVFIINISRLNFKDFKNSLLMMLLVPITPIYSAISPIKNLFKFKFIEILEENKKIESFKQKKDIILTDGDREISCTLEVVGVKGLYKAIFTYNNKHLESSKYSRFDLALDEIDEKLKAHGFVMKICLNCGYFKNDITGDDFSCGTCVHQGRIEEQGEITELWDCCENIISANARKHIQNSLK